MSTMIKKFFIAATTILIIFLSNSWAFSQSLEVNVKVGFSENPIIFIKGKFVNEIKVIDNNWSFLQNYADAENLGRRIGNLHLYDEKDTEVLYKKFADGEFVSNGKVSSFSYQIDAQVLTNTSANTHVSWIDKSRGLLMLNDLLPRFSQAFKAAKITFDLPENWQISSNENEVQANGYLVDNLENAVFLIGENWRRNSIQVNETKIEFVILDEWQFSDESAFEMAEEIIRDYAELFGGIPVKSAQIVLMDFPNKMEFGRWRAETRGANVTILSSGALAESFATQRLHEQLRHEIFHFWIPNSLNLEGDYAWFYEGFAIYQALKTGVNLGQIRFEDFLNTLEQAYFLNQKRSGDNSLIDISKMRWNGEVSSVYAKGMLVAFLCDAAILQRSKGKRDVKDLFRELYNKHGKLSERNDANTAVLSVLEDRTELTPIIAKYIKGKEKIDLAKYLSIFGIENVGGKTNADLKLKSKLSGRQKALLKKLGYNRRRNFNRRKINKNQ